MTAPSPVRTEGASDQVLLSGFAFGDTTAGLVFVRRFQGRVYGAAISLLGDRALAEDVTQEAFVRAWKHAGTYDPDRGSVAAWLLRTTRNLAIDSLRRRRPHPLDPDVLATLTPADPATAVEDAAITSELTGRARAAIAGLPPGQAKALLLAAFYGYTAQQVAVLEGIPLGTAKTRIRLGLRALRTRLTDPDPTDPDPTGRTNDRDHAQPARKAPTTAASTTNRASAWRHRAQASIRERSQCAAGGPAEASATGRSGPPRRPTARS